MSFRFSRYGRPAWVQIALQFTWSIRQRRRLLELWGYMSAGNAVTWWIYTIRHPLGRYRIWRILALHRQGIRELEA